MDELNEGVPQEMLGNDTTSSVTEVSTEPSATVEPGDSLYNEYVIVGVVLFFAVVVLIILIFVFVKRLRECCCVHSKSGLMEAYSSITYDDNSFDEIDDDSDSCLLYTTCQLHVGEVKVGASAMCVDKPEYDCVSVDDTLICTSETGSINSDRSRNLTAVVHYEERSWIR